MIERFVTWCTWNDSLAHVTDLQSPRHFILSSFFSHDFVAVGKIRLRKLLQQPKWKDHEKSDNWILTSYIFKLFQRPNDRQVPFTWINGFSVLQKNVNSTHLNKAVEFSALVVLLFLFLDVILEYPLLLTKSKCHSNVSHKKIWPIKCKKYGKQW